MRAYSLLMLLVLIACVTVGCRQSNSGQATANDTGKIIAKKQSSPARQPNVQLETSGPLTAISLRDTDLKLADLAKLDEAKRLEKIDAHSAGLTESEMAEFVHFSGLQKLELNVNTKITDDSLRHLKALGELRILSLFYCPQLTGSGFEHLAGLNKLENLNIGNNKSISDESLLHLHQLKNLQVLHASSLHGITDEGLKHFSGMSSLRRLVISGNQITDAGLEHLAVLKNLEVLTLSRRHSDAAIAKLQQELPNCMIQQ